MLASSALLFASGCSNLHRKDAATARIESDGEYVGNSACAPCHAAEHKEHEGSRHATTLRSANRATLKELTPSTGVIPLAGYSLDEQNGNLTLGRHAVSQEQTQPLSLVLGSGKLGMTYVAVLNADSLLETKMSYFPPWHMWDTTPGQEVNVPGDAVFGRVHQGKMARMCIGCHSTTLPQNGLTPDPKFFGVGCESCHGPGRSHVLAMQSGNNSQTHMEKLGSLTATKLNALCGQCHRSLKDIDVDSPEVKLTNRFQPYALFRSACRQPGGEPLSCLSCHDPHTDVSTQLKQYEAVCLKCHSEPHTRGHTRGAEGKAPASCPINKTAGCIGCHMPAKRAFSLPSIPATMADHLIAIPARR
jgi:predicted CXXCH cytochrome family protein